MKNRLLTTRWAFAVIGALLIATPGVAQLITADILGTVTDAAGAVVPNAKVTVVNTATSATRTLQTNGSGDYVFNLLPPGPYTVTVYAFTETNTSDGTNANADAHVAIPLTVK